MKLLKPINYVPPNSNLVFVKQTVIGVKSGDVNVASRAIYKCKCGNKTEALMNNVRRGLTKSCGCLQCVGHPTHGLSEHPLYCVWENMITRCYNKKSKAYNAYGGRGVKICKPWLENPAEFIKWGIDNGWKPGLQIDKDIHGGKLYSPKYCTFVSAKINSNNKRSNRIIYFNGESKTMAQWADSIGICHSAMHARLKKWGLKKSLTSKKYLQK